MKKPFLALVTLILLTSIVLANPLTDFTCSYFNLFCDNPPIIQKAYLNKEKFRPGEQMKITVAAKDDHKIQNVVAKIETENGTVETDMILIAGYKEDGTWQGVWKVHNVLYNRTYTTKVIVTDSSGQNASKTLKWYDPPVQGHPLTEIDFSAGSANANLDMGGNEIQNIEGGVNIGISTDIVNNPQDPGIGGLYGISFGDEPGYNIYRTPSNEDIVIDPGLSGGIAEIRGDLEVRGDLNVTGDINGGGSVSGGLYGYCMEEGGWSPGGLHCYNIKSPAYCVGNTCKCPSGYDKVCWESGSSTACSCYKQ